ncbi:MAG: hypothetical protein [Podoviridae sp. ctKoA10]|nr:MAG: hypothetical protein [Podoviridae sp. ctKoA10]
MLKLYKITETHTDGTQHIETRTSFDAYDALEEFWFDNQERINADEVVKLCAEYVRAAS